MSLPKVEIKIQNGQLGQTLQTDDGIAGMILTGSAVADKKLGDETVEQIKLNKPRQLFNLRDAEALGITALGENAFAHGQIQKFYEEAQPGAVLWIMLVDGKVSMTQACDPLGPYAPALEDASQRKIKLLAVSTKASTSSSADPVSGLDADVSTAVEKAQDLADNYAEHYRPFRVILDGKCFSGVPADLKDYTEDDKNRVCLFLCNDDKNSKNADVGTLAGRLAAIPVQRNIGRLKDGALEAKKMYFTDGKSVDFYQDAWEQIHDKGYIICRTYTGKSGYFFADDPTLTSPADDCNSLARGRVIDKVIELTYATYVNELLDEIPLDEYGNINPVIVKSWQNMIENAIDLTMTAKGEVSSVKAYINPDQLILETGRTRINLRILPVGYNKIIEVELGFDKNLKNA